MTWGFSKLTAQGRISVGAEVRKRPGAWIVALAWGLVSACSIDDRENAVLSGSPESTNGGSEGESPGGQGAAGQGGLEQDTGQGGLEQDTGQGGLEQDTGQGGLEQDTGQGGSSGADLLEAGSGDPPDSGPRCSDVACNTACPPGTSECLSNSVVRSCSDFGVWSAPRACANACVGGACAGECVPGAISCSVDAQPQTCSQLGEWEGLVACPCACVAGSCAGNCRPSALRCDPAGAGRQRCTDASVWVNDPCEPNLICSAGSCVDESALAFIDLEASCGNGFGNPGEECDDSNAVSGDGCSSTCQLEVGAACTPFGAECRPCSGS